ncbi:hypothetical protein WN944_014391 [Citrus x changshan-huyou]|uniref:Uncharacterized protein n=1 Tax=Citrus x changshan-huyou TaxID=2935761 RepID=A0AAP0QIP0_9ROSI
MIVLQYGLAVGRRETKRFFSSLCALWAVAKLRFGRSKWNGNVGSSRVVMRVDAPLSSFGRPSFPVQINSGLRTSFVLLRFNGEWIKINGDYKFIIQRLGEPRCTVQSLMNN